MAHCINLVPTGIPQSCNTNHFGKSPTDVIKDDTQLAKFIGIVCFENSGVGYFLGKKCNIL